MLSLVVRKGAYAQTHTYKVIDSPFRNLLGTARLGVSQGAFTVKTG